MKAYIYLYPIRRFFDFLAGRHQKAFEDSSSSPKRINDIIDSRYRQKGFVVYWLMPSMEDDPEKPDSSVFSNYIVPRKEDIFLSTGISHRTVTIEAKHPDYEFISGQIEDLTELAVGGFHQWCCVDKLAQYFYQKGIPTFVDEDTTEMFFIKTSLRGKIPLNRKRVLLGTGKRERLMKVVGRNFGFSKQALDYNKRMREERPWFRQI